MNQLELPLPDGYVLSSVTPGDQAALIEYLNHPAVNRCTGSIPSPYTESDASAWIGERQRWTFQHNHEVHFATVAGPPDGQLIGDIGVGPVELGQTRVAEVGYWLAQPFCGQGLMTQAVAATDYTGAIAHEFVPKGDPVLALQTTFAACATCL